MNCPKCGEEIFFGEDQMRGIHMIDLMLQETRETKRMCISMLTSMEHRLMASKVEIQRKMRKKEEGESEK